MNRQRKRVRKNVRVTAAAVAVAASAIIVGAPASDAAPGPITVTFTGETPGPKPNGYSTADAPDVLFYDTIGADVRISPSPTPNGNVIFAGGPTREGGVPDLSALEMRLTKPSTSIKLSFGNDDQDLTDRTDEAVLTVYRRATKVGEAHVNYNANDTLDQTISYRGPAVFNRAILTSVNAAGNPKGVAETVDDIVIGPLCTVTGTAGNNKLRGSGGSDVICGAGGDDRITGRGGGDLIYGGAGRDTILGGRGRDILKGGPGRDSCSGGHGTDEGHSCEVKRSIP